VTRPPDLAKLFDARGVAVIGASADVGKVAAWPLLVLETMQYQGAVFAVNPKYTEVLGRPCLQSIDQLPEEVEAAIIVMPAAAAVESVEACALKGIRAVVVGAAGFGELGPEGKELERRLQAVAVEHSMALVGPNSNGVASVQTGQALSYQPILQGQALPPGGVSVVSHSGAMVGAVVSRLVNRGLGFNALVSCGNQAVLSMEDFLGYLGRDPATRVVTLFVEAVVDATAMRSGLAACAAAGKPVVALKIGASQAGTRAAASHTGALAGSFVNTVAFLEKHGAVVVEDLDELALAVEALSRRPRPVAPAKPAVVTISGGLAALVADTACREGLPFPELGEIVNPYDLARYSPELVEKVMRSFSTGGFNVGLIAVPMLAQSVRDDILRTLSRTAGRAFGEVYVYLAGGESPDVQKLLAEAGAVSSDQLVPLVRTIRRLHRHRYPAAPGAASTEDAPLALDELSLKQWLAAVGLPSPRAVPFDGLGSIEGLQRPLVLKGLSGKIAHKTEEGLVVLGLQDDDAILAAASEIRMRLLAVDPAGSGVLAEEMVQGAVEAFAGCVIDPILGPVLAVGSGGTGVELDRDIVVMIPPVTSEEVRDRVRETRLGARLAGFRGQSYDLDALVEAALLVARLGTSVPSLDSLEVNPLFVLPSGVLVGDAKVELRAPAGP
jgi:acetate---CoA ligase (ADP-forming)